MVKVAHAIVTAALLPLSAVFADDQGNAIADALHAAPPAREMTDARREALAALDVWIARPGSERLEPVAGYYRAAIDRALDTLERERVGQGIRVVQLYSSSVIVQTPETVFAFDLDQGPNRGLTTTPDDAVEPFSLTPEQIARIARIVDYSFHTHEHDDHVDYAITRALMDAGKTVVVTESNREIWHDEPWAEKLVVLDQTMKKPVDVGPLKVDVLWDHQWNNAAHTSGTPCNAYVVTVPGGMTVMTKGDINCGLQLYGWLSLLQQRGQRIDVVAGSTVFWRGVNTLREWNALFEPLWLPGHNWEFTHRKDDEPKGNCGGYVESWQFARMIGNAKQVQVLSWGEWIDVSR
jgi:L-ascorbate metabolism protein UlaG (beta-lactamase superfamily)